MFGIINFEIFVLTGIALNITPGADTLYILGKSISHGKRAGILSAAGIATGALGHCLFAALGLSIILAQSALAFDLVKYLGAGYLIFLGIKALVSRGSNTIGINNPVDETPDLKKIYVSGMLVNLLNPKVALFFLAFLPQFIDPGYIKDALPFVILGLTFVFTGTIWCLVLALFSAKLAKHIRKNYKIKNWLDKSTGIVFLFLGLKLALSKK